MSFRPALMSILPAMLLGILICGIGEAAEKESPRPIRIVMVGDSTMASYPNPPADRPDLTGWGQVLSELLTEQATVVNRAASGRSSKSFIREGRWEKALAERPDYVFIQFGHNDCPGKGDRATDAETDFRDYLQKYIDGSRKAGATPVLVTPMTRRVFREEKIHTILRPYAEAMIAVGKKQDVPVIDLHAASVEMFNRLGDAGSADLNPSAGDRTHFSRKGALAIARLVVDRLPKAVPSLKPYVKP